MADTEKDAFTISPTGLDTFIGCPRRYHFKHTAKISEPKTKEKTSMEWLGADEKGTLVHRVMELYVNEAILPISQNLGTSEVQQGSDVEKKLVSALNGIMFAEKLFQTVWSQAIMETEQALAQQSYEAVAVPLSAKEKEMAELEAECRGAIAEMLIKMKKNQQYPVMTEKKFGVQRDGTGTALILKMQGREDIGICGSIDRVDYDVTTGSFIVIDYKTGSIDKKRKMRAGARDDLLQDRMYALALETMYPDKKVSGSSYIFPASGNQEIQENMTEESKEAFRQRLWAEADAIREKKDVICRGHSKEYPDWDNTCKYCGYVELCEVLDVPQTIVSSQI